GAALALAVLAALLERRLGNAPEFALGLLIGEVAVLATLVLNCVVLLWGGEEDFHTPALLTFVAHLPIAVLEGTVLGFVVGFLARVKPELLGWTATEGKALDAGRLPDRNGRNAHAPSITPPALPCPAPEFAGDAESLRPGPGAPP